jgi:predicted nucleic acid-binding protein
MVNKVISNTGPLIHCSEIKADVLFSIWKDISIPQEVHRELQSLKVEGIWIKKPRIVVLHGKSKDFAKALENKFDLDSGESAAIALVVQEKAYLFLTDDLDARTVAEIHNMEVHGTIGIMMRAFREKKLSREETIEKINELHKTSTLYITSDIIAYAIKEIEQYKN